MKAIPLNKARNWPVKDLTTGMKFQTKQGKIYIHKTKGGNVYICSNIPSLDMTRPRPMPVGYKYGRCVACAGQSYTNLTCGGNLSAFKQEETKLEESGRMKFTETFRVRGPVALLKALIEEAEKLGWRYKGFAINKTTTELNFTEGIIDSGSSGGGYIYNLPEEWAGAMSDAESQEEVDDVEYLECIIDVDGITKGRIYKRDMSEINDYFYTIEEPDYIYGDCCHDRDRFKPSTEWAFEEQGVNISSVGGHKINIQKVKINGYAEMELVCIGCKESEQIYSLGALRALRDAMCDDEATFEEENVTFSKEQVEALIERLEMGV